MVGRLRLTIVQEQKGGLEAPFEPRPVSLFRTLSMIGKGLEMRLLLKTAGTSSMNGGSAVPLGPQHSQIAPDMLQYQVPETRSKVFVFYVDCFHWFPDLGCPLVSVCVWEPNSATRGG